MARDLAVRGWATALRQVARRRSVILCYHGVADARLEDDRYRLQLSPARFAVQVRILRDAGFSFLTVAELARRAAGGPAPPGLAAITFDDALRNNHANALPILKPLGIPATVYVPTGWLGGRHPEIGAAGDPAILTGEEVSELARDGWEIGAHTVSHADLSQLDYTQCRSEIERSCAELEQLTGQRVETLAYPFGRYGPAAMTAARDCGLLAAVAGESGSWDPYELARTMVGGADSISVLLLKLTDRYERVLQSAAVHSLRVCKRQVRRLIVGGGPGEKP